LISPVKVEGDIKEAKRVGYLVERDDMSFYINDERNRGTCNEWYQS
jgi:hypothetical protein